MSPVQRWATNLATRWLSEPQCPLVLKRMLDIEVVLVMEDSNEPLVGFGSGIEASLTLRGDRDGCEVYLLRHGGDGGGCTGKVVW